MPDYTITLSDDELRAVGEGVSLLPYRQAYPIMGKLQAQINAQDIARQQTNEEKPQ